MPKPPIILDGGMSRELIRLGAPFKQPEWSALALLEAPDYVKQVHLEFAAAGADILTTNSYALVPFHIGNDRFENQGEELASLSGKLAREAADAEMKRTGRRVLVAGSLPPIFGSYEPVLFDKDNVQKYLKVLVRGLSPYVDIWLGETLSLIAEAAAVEVAVKSTGKPMWISFTIDDRGEFKNSVCLRSGESVADAARWAAGSSAESVLFNCSGPEFMTAAVRDARGVFEQRGRSLVIGVYANAFEPTSYEKPANTTIKSTRDDLGVETYTSFARECVAEGASIIGGCCGIGCEHIRDLVHAFRSEKGRDF